MDATKVIVSSTDNKVPFKPTSVDSRDNNTHVYDDFGSIDMPNEESSRHRHSVATDARSRVSHVLASVKKSTMSTPSRPVTSSMHYSTPRASYLQSMLNGGGNQTAKPGSVKSPVANKGGVQGTFAGKQSNYLQQVYRQ